MTALARAFLLVVVGLAGDPEHATLFEKKQRLVFEMLHLKVNGVWERFYNL